MQAHFLSYMQVYKCACVLFEVNMIQIQWSVTKGFLWRVNSDWPCLLSTSYIQTQVHTAYMSAEPQHLLCVIPSMFQDVLANMLYIFTFQEFIHSFWTSLKDILTLSWTLLLWDSVPYPQPTMPPFLCSLTCMYERKYRLHMLPMLT